MALDTTALEQDLVEWVRQWSEGETADEIEASTDLALSGAIDSMAFVGLVSYLEEETGVSFDFATFDLTGVVSIQTIIKHAME
jgi:acyl carrier protein